MAWLRAFYATTIGKKVAMGMTGILLVLFLVGHAAGNLLVFQGPEALNRWAHLLKSSAGVLWAVRLVLLAALALHVHAAWSLTMLNRAARPESYDDYRTRSSTISALSLRVGGVVLLLFIIFHLLDQTTGTIHPAFSPMDVYGNLMIGFSVWWVALFYLVAMAALGLHLHHGVWSFFQTMGWNHPHLDPLRRRLALVLAVGISGAFSAIVVAVAFRLIG